MWTVFKMLGIKEHFCTKKELIWEKENDIKIETDGEDVEEFNSLVSDDSAFLDWEKAYKLARYKNPPLILLDNIEEVSPPNTNACPIAVDIRDNLSNHYSV